MEGRSKMNYTKIENKKEYPGDVLRPEEDALIQFARQDLKTENIERLNELMNEGLNYGRLFKLAQRHRIAPLIGYHLSNNEELKERTEITNKKFKREMVISNIMNQAHNKKMYKELDRLQCLFDRHSIKWTVPIKLDT